MRLRQGEYRYVKKQRDGKRRILRELLGNQCARCGNLDNLHFDHIDSSTKSFDISQKLTFSLERLLIEVAKCQLLCRDCHIKKTLGDRGLKSAKHGSVSMYRNQKCRCDSCRIANTNYQRTRKRK